MRLITVGTGTVVPDPDRASSCYWLEHSGTTIVVDCGAGALQGLPRAGLAWGELGHLAVSHFHPDHIGEIPSLIFALRYGLAEPRTQPLEIWGPVGIEQLFEDWARALGRWLLEPGFPVSIREMKLERSYRIGEFKVHVTSTPHTEESLALRFEAAGASIGYTGDTGPDDALANFFRGVDLLLAECSLPDDLVGDNHLSPSRLARLAAGAEVDRLVVTHVYPQLAAQDVPELVRAAGYTGTIIMAHDGLEIAP